MLYAPPPASQPTFTIATHARLCAELAAFPAQRAAILARYKLDPRTPQQSLEAWWRAHVVPVPAQQAQWQAMYTEHYYRCVGQR
jgi:hypothetical protein